MDAVLVENRGKLSSALIADMIGSVTRNAVIGRATRLGLTFVKDCEYSHLKRIQRDRPVKQPKHKRSKVSKPPQFIPPPPEPQPSLHVSFFMLKPHHCRFPTSGEGLKTLFCGHPIAGETYCAGHHRISRAG